MPRKKRQQLLDSITEGLKKKFDNASINELIYLTAFVAGTVISYELLTGKPIVEFLGISRTPPVGQHTWLHEARTWTPPSDLQVDKLLMAFVASYMVLKIDVDDVVQATSQLTTLMKGSIGLVSP